MSDEERATWDRRYREGGYLPRPSPFSLLEQWTDRLPRGGQGRGRALDIACGAGRNALFLAAHGYEVDAVDGSPEALRLAGEEARTQELSVHWIEADLDEYVLPHDDYAVIVNCFYLNRPLLARLVDALADDGYIFIEQHLRTPLPIPGNRDWRMEPNELLRTLSGLRIVSYEEAIGKDEDPGRDRDIATVRAVACKGSGGF